MASNFTLYLLLCHVVGPGKGEPCLDFQTHIVSLKLHLGLEAL
jgi:hypothetical protein